jgi:hypothetical protein
MFGRRTMPAVPPSHGASRSTSRSAWPRILGGIVVGIALGYAALFAWPGAPSYRQIAALIEFSLLDLSFSLPGFSSNRLGRAETAPLLQTCFSTETMDIPAEVPPKVLYQIMHAAGTGDRSLAALGLSPEFKNLSGLRSIGAVAECLYTQPRLSLCDIDNRALAVEVTSQFLWGAEAAEAAPARDRAWSTDLGDVIRMRDRVVFGLSFLLREGVLAATDFGAMAPAAVTKEVAPVSSRRNACEQT